MAEAVFNTEGIIAVDDSQIADLIRQAEIAPRRRFRLCLHHSTDDLVQQMVIAFCRDSYVPPHRHGAKSESFHVIAGTVRVVFFDELGHVADSIRLSAPGGEAPFLYRLAEDRWHSVFFETETAVVHEIKEGPFLLGEDPIAPWAPDPEQAAEWMDEVRARIGL